MKNILCIGAGYVGGPTMAMIASKCPDYKVTVVDINQDRIDAWNSDELPVYEPGLLGLVKAQRGKNLFFSTEVFRGIEEAEIIFVCVNTPTKTFGKGAGRAANLQYCEITARQIREHAKRDLIVVEKSTVPVHTSKVIGQILRSGDSEYNFEVVSNPEFLAEGTAIEDLNDPDRVLIGGRPIESGRAAVDEVAQIYAHWIPEERIIKTDGWSSEMSKLTANAFLAQRVSSINSISALCEATGADVENIAAAIGADSRIGAKFLKAGPGFGGSCFKKDILNLVYLCESFGLQEVAEYWEQVVKMNDYQQSRIVANIMKSQFNTIAGKKVLILGFAFKADTGDTRESPAINIVKQLADEQAEIVICDPKALSNARQELKDCKNISYSEDVYLAAKDAHLVVLMTEWDEYKKLDFKKVFAVMETPASIFDTRNVLPHEILFNLGFNVYPMGKKPLAH